MGANVLLYRRGRGRARPPRVGTPRGVAGIVCMREELAWERAQAAVADAAAAVRALPPGGRELELGNLVEEAALAVLGDPKLAGAFLVACFAPDE